MQHEIASAHVLHDKVHSSLGLEASMKGCQEGVSFPVCDQEDSLFRPYAFNLVILNNELLLKNLDGVETPAPLRFGQHDLSEVALAEDSQEIEVIKTNPLSRAGVCGGRERLAL